MFWTIGYGLQIMVLNKKTLADHFKNKEQASCNQTQVFL